MRTLIHIFIFAAAIGCYATDMTNAPVIKVDSAHLMMQRADGSQADFYHAPACSSIVLDATGYTFDIPVELRGVPLNSIQVVQDKTHQFSLMWEPKKTSYELSAATLHPLRGSQSFEGFKTGDKLVVAIGVFEQPKKFSVVWVGMIQIQ